MYLLNIKYQICIIDFFYTLPHFQTKHRQKIMFLCIEMKIIKLNNDDRK